MSDTPAASASNNKAAAAGAAPAGGAAAEDDDINIAEEMHKIEVANANAPRPPSPLKDPVQRRERTMSVLSRISTDEALQRWINYQLSQSYLHGTPYLKRVHNFGGDMADGEILAVLISQVRFAAATY